MYTAPHTASDVSPSSSPDLSTAAAARLRREQAYLDIRTMVLVGEFAFGQRLAEEGIAEHLGVSRTPVREAFARLHADRLLNRYADGGFFVAEPDLIDLRDLYELRLTLELRGIARVAETGVAHDLSILMPLRDRWRAIRDSPPEPGGSFIELDESFHVGLSRSSGSMVISEMLESVNARIHPVRMHDFLTADRIELSIAEHLEILESVIVGDVELAAAQMRRHIGISMEVVEERAARAMTQMVLNRSRRRQ
jgi:DNA-binding GntR family transcriptional regulator